MTTITLSPEALSDSTLSRSALSLLNVLAELSDAIDATITITRYQLAIAIGASQRTVTDAINKLRKRNLLRYTPGSGRSVGRYQLTPKAVVVNAHTHPNTSPQSPLTCTTDPLTKPDVAGSSADEQRDRVAPPVVVNKKQQPIQQPRAHARKGDDSATASDVNGHTQPFR